MRHIKRVLLGLQVHTGQGLFEGDNRLIQQAGNRPSMIESLKDNICHPINNRCHLFAYEKSSRQVMADKEGRAC